MKFNLHPILFFLLFIGQIGQGYAEENLPNSSPVPLTEISPEQETLQRKPNVYHPDINIDRIERESDTFQIKFFNMLFLLALLIGFMILASWALKRMMKTKVTQLNTASTIKILETRYLSPRATLYLIEVGERTLLIAESPTTVTCLIGASTHAEPVQSEIKK